MAERTKPLLRGHFHQAAFFIALGAGGVLIASAHEKAARVVSLIYSLSLVGMFACSSLYHRINWNTNARMWWRRLDHAAIFLLIAGTGTPICIVGIKGDTGYRLLWIFWAMAVAGLFKELIWVKAPKYVSAIFYIIMGWAGVPFLSEMSSALGPTNMALMVVGGIIYTIGAVIYALKRPDPFPKTFGYHEIFHLLVVVASLLHFIVVYQLVTT